MRAAAAGHSTLGIPPKVAKDFVQASHGMKVSELPEEKGEPKKGHPKEERAEHKAGGGFKLKRERRRG
jgi:hypothetical protein